MNLAYCLTPLTRFARPLSMLVACLLVLVSFSSLQGCAALNGLTNGSTIQSQLIQDSVQLGVQLAIAHQPQASQQATAQQIILAATAAEGVLQNSQVAIQQLDQQLAQRLAKTSLPAATQALLTTVATQAVQQLAAKISAGAVVSGVQAPLLAVLGWIVAGATPFAGTPAAVAEAIRAGADQAAMARADFAPLHLADAYSVHGPRHHRKARRPHAPLAADGERLLASR